MSHSGVCSLAFYAVLVHANLSLIADLKGVLAPKVQMPYYIFHLYVLFLLYYNGAQANQLLQETQVIQCFGGLRTFVAVYRY